MAERPRHPELELIERFTSLDPIAAVTSEGENQSAAGAVVTKSLQRFRTYKVDADLASSAEQWTAQRLGDGWTFHPAMAAAAPPQLLTLAVAQPQKRVVEVHESPFRTMRGGGPAPCGGFVESGPAWRATDASDFDAMADFELGESA